MKAYDPSTQRLAGDLRTSADIKAKMATDPKGALKEAAQQFEALFLQQVLKSMRDTVPQDGPFDSEATRFYTGMLDQQLATRLASSGRVGLAKLIEQQLGRNMGLSPDVVAAGAAKDGAQPDVATPTPEQLLNGLRSNLPEGMETLPPGLQTKVAAALQSLASEQQRDKVMEAGRAANLATPSVAVAPAGGDGRSDGSPARDFVSRIWPHAVEASRSTGIPAQFLVAHAALESGWGKSEIRRGDGSSSYNLFGIKAGRSWQGGAVEAATTEYVGGVAQPSREKFRAYGSYAEAFRDYASLLQRPRFAGALNSTDGTEFARSLQQAGYATDPMYADKLSRIINGATLRQALSG